MDTKKERKKERERRKERKEGVKKREKKKKREISHGQTKHDIPKFIYSGGCWVKSTLHFFW